MSRPASHGQGDASDPMDHRRRYRSLSVVRPAPQAGVYMARARVGRTDGSPTSDYASNMHMRREHGRPTPGRGARVHVQQSTAVSTTSLGCPCPPVRLVWSVAVATAWL